MSPRESSERKSGVVKNLRIIFNVKNKHLFQFHFIFILFFSILLLSRSAGYNFHACYEAERAPNGGGGAPKWWNGSRNWTILRCDDLRFDCDGWKCWISMKREKIKLGRGKKIENHCECEFFSWRRELLSLRLRETETKTNDVLIHISNQAIKLNNAVGDRFFVSFIFNHVWVTRVKIISAQLIVALLIFQLIAGTRSEVEKFKTFIIASSPSIVMVNTKELMSSIPTQQQNAQLNVISN